MTVAMPSHRRKGKHGVVNTQVQSHPLLRRGFGTSVPFHSLSVLAVNWQQQAYQIEDIQARTFCFNFVI